MALCFPACISLDARARSAASLTDCQINDRAQGRMSAMAWVVGARNLKDWWSVQRHKDGFAMGIGS